MSRPPPTSTRTDTLVPFPTLFRSAAAPHRGRTRLLYPHLPGRPRAGDIGGRHLSGRHDRRGIVHRAQAIAPSRAQPTGNRPDDMIHDVPSTHRTAAEGPVPTGSAQNRLAGKRALITGAGQGDGRETAALFAAHGPTVWAGLQIGRAPGRERGW